MVFYNVCQYISDLKSGGTYLLWNEAGGSHTRSGVDLEQVVHLAVGYDPVHADDTVATEYVVYAQGVGLDLVAYAIGYAGRSDLIHLSAVFGVVVEELR